MKTLTKRPLACAFGVTLLAAGIPYWIERFQSVTLPLSQIAGLGIVFAMALIVRGFFRSGFLRSLAALGIVIPIVVAARIVAHPAAHPFWAFEMIVAVVTGFVAAFLGVLTGSALRLIARPSAPHALAR